MCFVSCQAAEEIYVDVARACTENNLLKFSAKGYLMQAGICALCYASDDDMAIKLEQYRSAQGWGLAGSCLLAWLAGWLAGMARFLQLTLQLTPSAQVCLTGVPLLHLHVVILHCF